MKQLIRWFWAIVLGSAVVTVIAVGIGALIGKPLVNAPEPWREWWGPTDVAEPACAFSVSGIVRVEGKPVDRLLIGLAFTERFVSSRAKTVTDAAGRFSLTDPSPEGCFGQERYIAIEDSRYLVSGRDGVSGRRNFGPIESGANVEIDLIPLRVY